MIRKPIVLILILLSLSAYQGASSDPARKTFVLTPGQKKEQGTLLDALQSEPPSKWVDSNLMPHRRLLELPNAIVEMKDGRRAYIFEVPATGESPPGTIDHLAIITDGGRSQPPVKSNCPLDDETILEVLYPVPVAS